MNIKCIQNIYKSANGVSNVTYHVMIPEDVSLRGIIQISHGMCEYFTRYTAFAKYLCGLGFVVCGNDHIGHGSSVARSADLGFFATRDGWKYLVSDVCQLKEHMKERYPDLPYFLFGHGMGSSIVRLCLPVCGSDLAGCILSAVTGPDPRAVTMARLSDSIAHSRGMTYRSGFLADLLWSRLNKKIPQAATAFDWISRDPQVVALYQSDEKCNFVFTATGFRDFYTLSVKANAPHLFRQTPHDLPLLLLTGDRDPTCRYGESVRRVVNMYRGAGQKNVDAIFYKDARHEILNEVNRMEVFGDISRWLEKQLAEPEAAVEQPG